MIIVFSGTGNTLHLARLLAAHLEQKLLHLREPEISNPTEVHLAAGEPVIWAFPVYSWGVPPVVVDYIKRCRISTSDTVHHAMLSYGDDAGHTARQFRRIIASRGYRAGGVYGLQMPNTYVFMPGFDVDSPEIERTKVAQAEQAIVRVARQIDENTNGECVDDYTKGSFAWLKSSVIRPVFERFYMNPRDFRVSDACTACGACAGLCPLQNIRIEEFTQAEGTKQHITRRAVHGTHCAFCLACYHTCPHKAIGYKTQSPKGQKKILR